MKYIESKPNSDGTFDHTEVRAAYEDGRKVEFTFSKLVSHNWFCVDDDEPCGRVPTWNDYLIYRATVPDTYGIHESSSTLREVKGDGPAVAEMLLDGIAERDNRIRELEDDLTYALDSLDKWACYSNGPDPELDERLIRARAALNKEQK